MDGSIESPLVGGVRENGLETPIRGQRAGFDSAAGEDHRENISFFEVDSNFRATQCFIFSILLLENRNPDNNYPTSDLNRYNH